jgi:hypothetical protein
VAQRGYAAVDTAQPSAGQFTYNLATDTKWTGGCRRVVLTLDDGTTRVANFRFR